MHVEKIQERLREFAAARDWDQFHSPKNLAMALAAEAGELLELFQWLTEERSRQLVDSPEGMARVREEIADVQIYLLRLADKLGVDLEKAVEEKIVLNEGKYPVELSKGNATKADRR